MESRKGNDTMTNELEKRILNAMTQLNLTREEALEMFADDEDIDHGAKKDFDLTPEQEKVAKKARITTSERKPINLERGPRKRKEDPTKRRLITVIKEAIEDMEDVTVDVTNVERELMFDVDGNTYTILLQKLTAKGKAGREAKAKAKASEA